MVKLDRFINSLNQKDYCNAAIKELVDQAMGLDLFSEDRDEVVRSLNMLGAGKDGMLSVKRFSAAGIDEMSEMMDLLRGFAESGQIDRNGSDLMVYDITTLPYVSPGPSYHGATVKDKVSGTLEGKLMLVPKGFDSPKGKIEEAGFLIVMIDTSGHTGFVEIHPATHSEVRMWNKLRYETDYEPLDRMTAADWTLPTE